MNRNTILDALRDDISDHIQSGDTNYSSDIAECKRGIHSCDDITNKPFIGIFLDDDDVDQEIFDSTGTDQVRRMRVRIYAYMDSDGLGNYDDLFRLIDDVEYFLKNDFTYKDNTYVGKIRTVEGGVTSPIAFFDMYISIVYQIDI